jgi:phosphonate transport system ATP-binding protein
VSAAAAALELSGVTRSFGGRPVLRELDLVVPAGQVLALLGPSGAGKTTLLRVLSGVLPPQSGSVRVLGRDLALLRGRQRRELRRRVGLLYQNDALVPGLSVAHNVLIGRLGSWSLLKSLVSLVSPRELPLAAAALRAVQMEEKLFEPIGALSGGQRQRVTIARLLLQDPEIVLADEPAAALDPRLARHTLSLLIRLSRERGRTLLVTLHDMDLVTEDFDRVLALRGGEWFWEGRPSELNRERIAAIFAEDEGDAPLRPGASGPG